MEQGVPITIKPKNSSVLVFQENGDKIFTKKEIKIQYPGGKEARGSYQKTFDEFFRLYFSQSFSNPFIVLCLDIYLPIKTISIP